MTTQNPSSISLAVALVGGPTKTSTLLGVSNSTIHSWIKQGYVSRLPMAIKLSQASGVSVEDLLARKKD